MSAKEPTPPPEGVVRPDPSPAPRMPTAEEWTEVTRAHIDLIAREEATLPRNPMDRIATALERLVELAEQGEPEMDVDVEIDADGKLMHVTAECQPFPPNAPNALGAYVLAHDPDAAARAAKTWWGENGHVGITGVQVNYDD